MFIRMFMFMFMCNVQCAGAHRCQKVFKAGMKKFEYKGKQWHEACFLCLKCQKPIGNKSFIPRDMDVVCVPCYEEHYAQKCTACKKVRRSSALLCSPLLSVSSISCCLHLLLSSSSARALCDEKTFSEICSNA